MTADLTEAVQRRDICQQTRPALTKEPLMTYLIPNLPWQIVTSDGSHYQTVVDLYSDVKTIELSVLSRLDWTAKQMFAVHGIPITLMSDNGPNYASIKYIDFTQDWDIQHVTSSSHHPKENGTSQQPRSDWKPGVILENIAPRSYLVEVNGPTYRRNCVHLRNAVQSQTDSLPVQNLTRLRPQVCLRTNLLTMITTRLAISD